MSKKDLQPVVCTPDQEARDVAFITNEAITDAMGDANLREKLLTCATGGSRLSGKEEYDPDDDWRQVGPSERHLSRNRALTTLPVELKKNGRHGERWWWILTEARDWHTLEAVIGLFKRERPGRADIQLEASRYLFRERLDGLSEDAFADVAVGLGRMALAHTIPKLDGDATLALARKGLPLTVRMDGLAELLAKSGVDNATLTQAIGAAKHAERMANIR